MAINYKVSFGESLALYGSNRMKAAAVANGTSWL